MKERTTPPLLQFLLPLLPWLTNPGLCFNLEPRAAIVKEGAPGSYFGYAVEQHQTLLGADAVESSLLVGAPLAASDGVAYKCPFTARSDDCQKIRVKAGKEGRKRKKGYNEEGEWIGSVIKSQGPGRIFFLGEFVELTFGFGF